MRRTAAAVLAAVLAPEVALYGWGQKGHGIVGDIAQERLTEVTKRNVHSPRLLRGIVTPATVVSSQV
jgi:hypothetical protein